ncbi:probable tRNA N6-adenosine threonylcarbamoyltransferase, mitochondrial [Protopterus annectens]|uniref:probable tRNA N6-adenosine threonylcarbamoyltransferase, mitochondrial n=1 Tax=Protopterus annectens TaxID=7888 RepID=UPI001CF98D31|nr:probable tRNA N6-adenosine threonylcarbamoyltransferase, mitochondrial [Protopterus annectens]
MWSVTRHRLLLCLRVFQSGPSHFCSSFVVLSQRVMQRNLVKYFHSARPLSRARIVLGIETSCDDTAAAVVDETGRILGEALHSQKDVHLKTGGIIPPVAQKLHRENIEEVITQAIERSKVSSSELTAIATTVKPGLALSLGVGLEYSLKLVAQFKKPFIPIHHMEAHALMIRMINPVTFPFLVLLVSGGHSILAIARGVTDFQLLGQSLDEAPGDTLDKIARRLSLIKHPQCGTMSGGQAIEHLAKEGNRLMFELKLPMSQNLDCNFSFAGLRNQVNQIISKKEKEEGIQNGQILSCAADIAASAQHTIAVHVAKRTHRAIMFCKMSGLLPDKDSALVVSGGVASNQYIRKVLQVVANATKSSLLCPPPHLCTDNGVMIAWNGIERLSVGQGILHNTEGIQYEPKAPLGSNISEQVKNAAIKLPRLKFTV